MVPGLIGLQTKQGSPGVSELGQNGWSTCPGCSDRHKLKRVRAESPGAVCCDLIFVAFFFFFRPARCGPVSVLGEMSAFRGCII
jgi:hypothetical protein